MRSPITFPYEEMHLISCFNCADLHFQHLDLVMTLFDLRALYHQTPSPLVVIYRFD